MRRPIRIHANPTLPGTLRRCISVIAVLAMAIMSTAAHATAVRQAPWASDVAAYRTALFLACRSARNNAPLSGEIGVQI